MKTDPAPPPKKHVIFYFYSKSGMMEEAKVVNVYKCNIPMFNVIEINNMDVWFQLTI
jgi:hypothetical protein